MSPKEVDAMGKASCNGVEISFSGKDGSIRSLVDSKSAISWLDGSDPSRSMAAYKYQTYSAANFDEFSKTYTTSGDFMKQGMEKSKAVNKTWETKLLQGYRSQTGSRCNFVMQLTMADASAWIDYGAAKNISIEYVVPGRKGA